MRILIVEDEAAVADFVREGLEHHLYHCEVAADGASGLEMGLVNRYDVVLLDYNLPGMDGLEVLRRWRAAGLRTPVLMLTARDAISDRVAGLSGGADDYLVKPFAFAELLARIRVLARRGTPQLDDRLVVGPLRLDLESATCTRDGQPIPLTAQEFRLLEYFMRHPGKVVSRDVLAEHVWGQFDYGSSNKIEVYVYYLRNKIDKGFDRPLLHTVRGLGYVLKHEQEA